MCYEVGEEEQANKQIITIIQKKEKNVNSNFYYDNFSFTEKKNI